MALRISKQEDGGLRMEAVLDEQPKMPAGYRLLRADEQVAAGDLVYNLLLCQWQDAESVLWLMPMVEALGGWASPVPILRKAG